MNKQKYNTKYANGNLKSRLPKEYKQVNDIKESIGNFERKQNTEIDKKINLGKSITSRRRIPISRTHDEFQHLNDYAQRLDTPLPQSNQVTQKKSYENEVSLAQNQIAADTNVVATSAISPATPSIEMQIMILGTSEEFCKKSIRRFLANVQNIAKYQPEDLKRARFRIITDSESMDIIKKLGLIDEVSKLTFSLNDTSNDDNIENIKPNIVFTDTNEICEMAKKNIVGTNYRQKVIKAIDSIKLELAGMVGKEYLSSRSNLLRMVGVASAEPNVCVIKMEADASFVRLPNEDFIKRTEDGRFIGISEEDWLPSEGLDLNNSPDMGIFAVRNTPRIWNGIIEPQYNLLKHLKTVRTFVFQDQISFDKWQNGEHIQNAIPMSMYEALTKSDISSNDFCIIKSAWRTETRKMDSVRIEDEDYSVINSVLFRNDNPSLGNMKVAIACMFSWIRNKGVSDNMEFAGLSEFGVMGMDTNGPHSIYTWPEPVLSSETKKGEHVPSSATLNSIVTILNRTRWTDLIMALKEEGRFGSKLSPVHAQDIVSRYFANWFFPALKAGSTKGRFHPNLHLFKGGIDENGYPELLANETIKFMDVSRGFEQLPNDISLEDWLSEANKISTDQVNAFIELRDKEVELEMNRQITPVSEELVQLLKDRKGIPLSVAMVESTTEQYPQESIVNSKNRLAKRKNKIKNDRMPYDNVVAKNLIDGNAVQSRDIIKSNNVSHLPHTQVQRHMRTNTNMIEGQRTYSDAIDVNAFVPSVVGLCFVSSLLGRTLYRKYKNVKRNRKPSNKTLEALKQRCDVESNRVDKLTNERLKNQHSIKDTILL